MKNAQLKDAPLKRRRTLEEEGKSPSLAPGGRRADQDQGMRKSAQCATVCVNKNQARKEADGMKWCKSESHFTEKDRFMIQKIRNTPDHLPHVSVREAAKILGLCEATLRRERKKRLH